MDNVAAECLRFFWITEIIGKFTGTQVNFIHSLVSSYPYRPHVILIYAIDIFITDAGIFICMLVMNKAAVFFVVYIQFIPGSYP